MRELWWMAESKQISEWDQSSLLWSAIANTIRDAKKRPQPFEPMDVHPFRKKDAKKVVADISILKGLVPNGR